MTERLSDKNPCTNCKADRQIGNPNRWECECSRCDKPNDWKNDCIKKLAEYETAEEERRLVILPKCKIGDRVYLPIDFENKIYSGKVHGYMYFEPRKEWVVKIRLDGTEIQYCHEKFEDFRNTFFLDYEEAEDKLKEMNKNE